MLLAAPRLPAASARMMVCGGFGASRERRAGDVLALQEESSDMWSTLFGKETGANREEDSHLHIEKYEDGSPKKARYTYVDEHTCIGELSLSAASCSYE